MAAGSGPFTLRTLPPWAVFLAAAVVLPVPAGLADEWRPVEEGSRHVAAWDGPRSHPPASSLAATPLVGNEPALTPATGSAADVEEPASSAAPAPETPPPSSRPSPPRLTLPGAGTAGEPLAELPTAAEIGRLALATGVVVVIAAVGLGVYRHLRWGAAGRRPHPAGLTWHASISLGARNGLHLVSVTDRRFLVAVDARGVSCITPISVPFEELTLSESGEAAAMFPEHSELVGPPGPGRA